MSFNMYIKPVNIPKIKILLSGCILPKFPKIGMLAPFELIINIKEYISDKPINSNAPARVDIRIKRMILNLYLLSKSLSISINNILNIKIS